MGKTIEGIVVKNRPAGSVKSIVFLTFTDGTMFEFYCREAYVEGAGPRPGGRQEALDYLARDPGEVQEYGFDEPANRSPGSQA